MHIMHHTSQAHISTTKVTEGCLAHHAPHVSRTHHITNNVPPQGSEHTTHHTTQGDIARHPYPSQHQETSHHKDTHHIRHQTSQGHITKNIVPQAWSFGYATSPLPVCKFWCLEFIYILCIYYVYKHNVLPPLGPMKCQVKCYIYMSHMSILNHCLQQYETSEAHQGEFLGTRRASKHRLVKKGQMA